MRGAADRVDRGEILRQQLIADDALERGAVRIGDVARDRFQLIVAPRARQVARVRGGMRVIA